MPRRVLHDQFFKKAKDEGYLARSAYKLQEIAERHRLIARGQRVLDLGCAPGAWLQVASEIVSGDNSGSAPRAAPPGVVVGIDLKEVRDRIAPNVHTIVADAYEIDPAILLNLAGGPFDAVLSDMAPDTTGAGDTDHHRSIRLCRRVLDLLPPLLRRGGNLAMKVFEGGSYPALLKDTAALFNSAKGFKPKASRDISREIYIVALGYRGTTGPTDRLRPDSVIAGAPDLRPEGARRLPGASAPGKAQRDSSPGGRTTPPTASSAEGVEGRAAEASSSSLSNPHIPTGHPP